MFYRENGQFKTSYRSDQQIFPIAQDRIAIAILPDLEDALIFDVARLELSVFSVEHS